MNRQKLTAAILALGMSLSLAAHAIASPSVFPTGTTIYDPARAYNGFVMLNSTTIGDTFPKLVDMNGNEVHNWNQAFKDNGIPFAERVVLLENGNLLAMKQGNPRFIAEFDWDGNLVWRWEHESEAPHHYIARLDNGNTVFLLTHTLTPEQTAGAENYSDRWFGERRRDGVSMTSDKIIEVNPAGEIVWEWALIDDPYYNLNMFAVLDPVADWIHSNTCSIIPENKWYDAGDARFKPGNILFNPRNLDEIAIIDKDSRQVVWTYKSDYRGGLAHPHEPEMIAKGLPGEGNIILFDNGLFSKDRGHDGYSYILEIDPIEKEIVWKYEASNFYSSTRSSQTRLPNGNTLISEDNSARAFQVTPEGEIVWEYVGEVGILLRTRPIAYDYCPQLANLPRTEIPVATPANAAYKVPLAQ